MPDGELVLTKGIWTLADRQSPTANTQLQPLSKLVQSPTSHLLSLSNPHPPALALVYALSPLLPEPPSPPQ
jgi:hypothetical protein